MSKGRHTNWVAEIDGYLLMGLGTMLILKLRAGQLASYIHPRYTMLVTVTAVLIIVVGFVRSTQPGPSPQRLRKRIGAYGLLLAPVLLGVILPATAPGAALVDARQLNAASVGYGRNNAPLHADTKRWNLLDWKLAQAHFTPNQARGKPVDVVGFVYHDSAKDPTHISVVRYVIACCVADRRGVGLTVRSAVAAGLADDTWVRLTGQIDTEVNDNTTTFVVADAHLQTIDPPLNPFLYLNP